MRLKLFCLLAPILIVAPNIGLALTGGNRPVFNNPPNEVVGGGAEGEWASPLPRDPPGHHCNEFYPRILSVLGSEERAKCYTGIFRRETGCNPYLQQKQGQAHNPYAAYGFCSLERDLSIRRKHHRGPDCEDISTVENQVRCCRAIMLKTPRYFGVGRGKGYPRCD